MKIEIELQAVEALRNEVKILKDDNKLLASKIEALNAEALEGRAIGLAQRLVANYITAIFKKLGFETYGWNGGVDFENLNHWIGKKWYEQDKRFEVRLSATLADDLRAAFMRIGVMNVKEVAEENLLTEV